MSENELEIKKFELDQKIKLEEIELKKKELDLKLKEQRRVWTSAIPLVLGLLTIAYSAYSHFQQRDANHELEDKKLLSSLIVGAVEKENYDEFAKRIDALDELGLIKVDSMRLAKFKQARFMEERNRLGETVSGLLDTTNLSLDQMTKDSENLISEEVINRGPASVITIDPNSSLFWMIIAGGDKNLEGAQFEKQKAKKAGFEKVDIWLKGNSYRTVIGSYNSYQSAVEALFVVRERINKTAYLVRNTSWCQDSEFDESRNIILCK